VDGAQLAVDFRLHCIGVMTTSRKLTLNKETILMLTNDELEGAHSGTSTPVTTTIQYTPEVQSALNNVSIRCGLAGAAKNWWDKGGKDFVKRALHTEHCPLSGGTATGNC
jgi:hypothetical protein